MKVDRQGVVFGLIFTEHTSLASTSLVTVTTRLSEGKCSLALTIGP